jgi:hypothetical protein
VIPLLFFGFGFCFDNLLIIVQVPKMITNTNESNIVAQINWFLAETTAFFFLAALVVALFVSSFVKF